MSWTCPGHYKVHVHGQDSPGRSVHGYCPVPLPALLYGIVFTNKIRVYVWPKSGKVNIFGFKAELTGALICEFIRDVFHARWSDLVCDTPIC